MSIMGLICWPDQVIYSDIHVTNLKRKSSFISLLVINHLDRVDIKNHSTRSVKKEMALIFHLTVFKIQFLLRFR